MKITKGTETILLTDDEENVLEVSQGFLEAMGSRVFIARDGNEAVMVLFRSRST